MSSAASWRRSDFGRSRPTPAQHSGSEGPSSPAAVRAGRQLVRLVPLRESGYQVLMRALACQGNVAEALRVYSDLCDILREELGVSPSQRHRPSTNHSSSDLVTSILWGIPSPRISMSRDLLITTLSFIGSFDESRGPNAGPS